MEVEVSLKLKGTIIIILIQRLHVVLNIEPLKVAIVYVQNLYLMT